MAGGNAYCEFSLVVDGDTIEDVTEWSVLLGAELLSNRSAGRKYPQKGCAVNHSAEIGCKTHDLKAQTQTFGPGTGSLLLGSDVSSVVLTADNITGTSAVFRLEPARVARAQAQGGHARLADADFAWEVVGTAGAEPSVGWGLAA